MSVITELATFIKVTGWTATEFLGFVSKGTDAYLKYGQVRTALQQADTDRYRAETERMLYLKMNPKELAAALAGAAGVDWGKLLPIILIGGLILFGRSKS